MMNNLPPGYGPAATQPIEEPDPEYVSLVEHAGRETASWLEEAVPALDRLSKYEPHKDGFQRVVDAAHDVLLELSEAYLDEHGHSPGWAS